MKSKFGVIALILALLALCCGIAAFLPLTPLTKYPDIRFFGSINLIFGGVCCVLAIAALVFGIIGRKKSERKGTATAGMIIGIFMIVIGISGSIFGGLMGMVADYINEKPGNFISENMKESDRQELDKTLNELLKGMGAEVVK